jgi:HemY protein
MKTALAIVLALLLGALVANFILQDNGYVLIHFRGYAIEMSVPVLVVLFILNYMGVRLLVHTLSAPRKLGEAAGRYRQRKAGERITRGYIEIGEGNFQRGEKLLTRGVRNSETPLLNYLAAARAAQAQGDRKRRDNWLRMAYEQEPKAAAAVLLTQAELQLDNEEYETCRATLNKVLEMTPNNAEALRLKAQLCLLREDWRELKDILPRLQKRGHVAQDIIDEWFVRTWTELIKESASDPKGIAQLWKQVPKRLRDEPRLLKARVHALVVDGQVAEADKIIRKALDKNWNKELILLYGTLPADAAAQLRYVEKRLHKRPEDPALLLTAARLSVRNELWGKARSYFETSNAIRPSAETWHDLGQLMLQLGEDDSASKAFQQGLSLTHAGSVAPKLTNKLGPDSAEV